MTMNKNKLKKAVGQSPLDHLLQEELWPNIGPAAESGCLLLLPAQTGIGKTHTIKTTILHELLAEDSASRKGRVVYYITNSVDNVHQTYQEVLELIETQKVDGSLRFSAAEQERLKQQIIYLPSQSNQLIDLETQVIYQILELFELGDNQPARQAMRAFINLRETLNDHKNMRAALQESLRDKANTAHRLLVNQIQARQHSENPINLTEEQHGLLDKLLPGDRIERGVTRICFMTTRKFLAGYQTLKSRVHPIRELNGALLFIDEFDRQNEVILAYMAEQQAVDLIELTRTLHVNLQRYQLERSARYAGIDALFDSLRKDLDHFAEQWQLEYAFNVEGRSLADEKVRLFSDRTITHVHSSKHLFKLRTEQELQKNIIYSERKAGAEASDEQNKRLSRFINQADRLFQRFISAMRSAVYQYQNNVVKADAEYRQAYGVTMQEAVMSILRHYNLQDLSQGVFTAFDAQLFFSGGQRRQTKKTHWAALRSYHDRGLKLTDVRKNIHAHDTVSCYFTGLSATPTGLLARLVASGAKVVGISATATSDTVIKNFDLRFLKTRLGEQMLELTSVQKTAIAEYYQERRRYQEAGVAIEAEFVAADPALLASALTNHTGRPIRNVGSLLGQWLDLEGNSDFAIGWVSKLLRSLESFVASTSNRYMLVLLNRTVSDAKQPEFVQFLETHLQEKAQLAGCRIKLFPGMNAHAMRDGKFEKALNHLGASDDKVIMLSTYAAMGEGKNPDYSVKCKNDRAQLVWVGSGPEPKKARADIDSLFLEKPTHQLLTDEDYQANQLLLFHQIMVLQEAGWISPREARSWVKKALQGVDRMEHLKLYYATEDYTRLLHKIIEQAVGRMARTAFKRWSINIYADSDLASFLENDERPKDLLSHEYHALRALAASGATPALNTHTTERMHNLAEVFTADTLSLIRELLSGFTGADPARAIESWEDVRTQLLSHPTLASPDGDYPRLYLQSPVPEGYQFSGSLEVDDGAALGRDLCFFNKAQGSRWVTEDASGLPILMKNPAVRQHFEKQGFATHWLEHHYLLNPAAFLNIYKGALGEEGVISILLAQGLLIEPMPLEVYEVCDFIVRLGPHTTPVAVDAKNWQHDGEIDNHAVKVGKLKQVGIENIAYINLFASEQNQCRYLTNELTVSLSPLSPVIEVPGVVNASTGETLIKNVQVLLQWLGELR